jgi:hypothetical protein
MEIKKYKQIDRQSDVQTDTPTDGPTDGPTLMLMRLLNARKVKKETETFGFGKISDSSSLIPS